jgi:3-dehydroquinate dehydratase-2
MPKPRRAAPGRRDPAAARKKILVLNGPTLNLLGTREPNTCGRETLVDIVRRLAKAAAEGHARLEAFQSNQEGALIDRVRAAKNQGFVFIIVNSAGFTHSSVALRDALAAVSIPFIEVHLSNIHAREPFRRHSYFSDLAVGTICGLGSQGYDLALEYALAS